MKNIMHIFAILSIFCTSGIFTLTTQKTKRNQPSIASTILHRITHSNLIERGIFSYIDSAQYGTAVKFSKKITELLVSAATINPLAYISLNAFIDGKAGLIFSVLATLVQIPFKEKIYRILEKNKDSILKQSSLRFAANILSALWVSKVIAPLAAYGFWALIWYHIIRSNQKAEEDQKRKG